MSYEALIEQKRLKAPSTGLSGALPPLASHLFAFQKEAVEFGLVAGSWGCFFDTGLGKTRMQLEWCAHAADATNGRALILTPLAVARQIEAEGRSCGYNVRVIRSKEDVREGINVCNYDRLHLLEEDDFGAVSLDEASILKSFTGIASRSLIAAFAGHRFRCAATATPAPNDHTELSQYASFLGVMNRDEMLTRWFINDSGDTKSWRLKGHAVIPFFDWMSSWARMAQHPRDLGDDVPGFDLLPLEISRHQAREPETPITGGLFGGDVSATGIHEVKRQTIEARAEVVADLVMSDRHEPWIIWCDTDYESDALKAAIPEAADVRGSQPIDVKERTLAAFADGTVRVLISKPSVCGFGLNWQHCARIAFVGRSFSYESWYQAVRRCWRFGQKRPVQVHLIVAEGEDAIGKVIDRKADDHERLRNEMRAAMARALGQSSKRVVPYTPTYLGRLPSWLKEYVR